MAFFNSFLSSNMPKRLLRYTLSKLDYLDTDALDMDNLDLAMGKNNVFTLQNVEIKLQACPNVQYRSIFKYSSPIAPNHHTSAIYANPITVEIDGVEIKLRLTSRDDSLKKAPKGAAHRKKGSASSEDGDPVPHAIDLAQSFLETQPSKDKAELQAALQAETQDLGASILSSEDGSDEDYSLGTGQPLSLPTFLADFLQGILDWLQVSIKGVTFHLDIEVPPEPNTPVSELVTFQLAVDEVNVEGVTTAADETTKEGQSKITYKEGKRYVGLNKIRASLISEANVFSTLARSPSIPSSVATDSPAVTQQQSVSGESISRPMVTPELRSDADDLEQRGHRHPLMDAEDAFNIPYDLSGSNDGHDEESASAPSTPRALAPQILQEDEPNADALLTVAIENLNVDLSGSSTSVKTSVDVGKFKLGYGNDDIISFDQRIQMRASVNDAFPPAGADISVKLSQSPTATKCEVTTLPLHVKIDLQRLDETFSWFGGLSGFLNMSSSMTSSSPPTPRIPVKPPPKARGVRFDAPIRPDDISASSENKMNMRLGGFRLDIVGKECSVALDTSAIKLVSREEGIGIGISKIHLAGPYMRRSMGDPPINAVVTNTRLEYLMTPKDNDLERLLELIIPSKYKFDQNDDEIMVDTLLRQRRKGAVLRVNVDDIEVNVSKLQQLEVLPTLGEEIARLSTVAKYLPEDDRPGILTLALVRNLDVTVDIDRKFGSIQASLKDAEMGHITIPSLIALGVGSISIIRNHTEELVGTTASSFDKVGHGPILTMRVIGDEMEPVVKIRMRNINIEYRVPTIMDILGLAEDTTPRILRQV
ncbi:Autophagy-related protein 2 [Daldinia childiae]|uniref:Autophagy-related protein 2 n=1 Tax=Daldinia childiae TaxID=326645 RepID=UPI0014465FC5|nr:Autophagy-related protein 2 [Daldinia childiae]KAF3058059.1 Autophagy-related protein 2 [Daldinia childiae]